MIMMPNFCSEDTTTQPPPPSLQSRSLPHHQRNHISEASLNVSPDHFERLRVWRLARRVVIRRKRFRGTSPLATRSLVLCWEQFQKWRDRAIVENGALFTFPEGAVTTYVIQTVYEHEENRNLKGANWDRCVSYRDEAVWIVFTRDPTPVKCRQLSRRRGRTRTRRIEIRAYDATFVCMSVRESVWLHCTLGRNVLNLLVTSGHW
ncbi:hypothetical protein L210DRAFT_3504845 [Boletus edulis BED1]|uniref:Uncharacterized protein n=1 Tax=Boletus edulis BED1 TaxID=1328754 RepID=A0AAD4BSC5_BOLED|nr:hypothetical protein L210DRAFT_3504845 [Boletus edulis BED1]